MSGGRDAFLRVWNLETPSFQLEKSIPAHLFTINSLVFSPDKTLFATASRDRTIKIWNAATFELLKVVDAMRDGGHIRSVNRLFWETETGFLVSASDDRSLMVWEID